MEKNKAGQLFENVMKEKVFSIERCNTGIGNYVFVVTSENNKYILRCSLEKDAYENTVHWLKELEVCDIPIPKVISFIVYCFAWILWEKEVPDIWIKLSR